MKGIETKLTGMCPVPGGISLLVFGSDACRFTEVRGVAIIDR